jgi:hypothetical protein
MRDFGLRSQGGLPDLWHRRRAPREHASRSRNTSKVVREYRKLGEQCAKEGAPSSYQHRPVLIGLALSPEIRFTSRHAYADLYLQHGLAGLLFGDN